MICLLTKKRIMFFESDGGGEGGGQGQGQGQGNTGGNNGGEGGESGGESGESEGGESQSESQSESQTQSFTTEESIDSMFSDPNEGDKGDVSNADNHYDNNGHVEGEKGFDRSAPAINGSINKYTGNFNIAALNTLAKDINNPDALKAADLNNDGQITGSEAMRGAIKDSWNDLSTLFSNQYSKKNLNKDEQQTEFFDRNNDGKVGPFEAMLANLSMKFGGVDAYGRNALGQQVTEAGNKATFGQRAATFGKQAAWGLGKMAANMLSPIAGFAVNMAQKAAKNSNLGIAGSVDTSTSISQSGQGNSGNSVSNNNEHIEEQPKEDTSKKFRAAMKKANMKVPVTSATYVSNKQDNNQAITVSDSNCKKFAYRRLFK